ncbi:MAG: TonB-dependent receptor, partial [Bacteroidia bacterium]|nr:TonB-dependent receptor [Bacteroidia bacterium]
MKNILLVLFTILIPVFKAQTIGVIRGKVIDKNTQEALVGAVVSAEGTSYGVATDLEGNYKLDIPVGTYRLKASLIGYNALVKENVVLNSGNAQIVNFELDEAGKDLEEVNITFDKGKSAVATDMITPLSVQQLTSEEVKSNPGGNFDVSKVIQTLPGVGGSGGGAARNDIIIRGGAPNENVYYLDGIEIPILNHFQTQGSSGGATGILNVSFIDDVKLSSSAFDARYDNALASTFIIKQREGNPEKLSGNFRLSGTETALTLEGPLGKKTNFLASARRSYLQYLFQVLDLPIRPNFWDFQYKVTHKLNEKTTITAIGIGAIDEFAFATPKKSTPENIYITRSLPYINQWNYTSGFTLKRLINKGFVNVALSRNMFNNALDKFEDQNQVEENRTFKLRSQEIENKFRADINKYLNGWKISAGVMAQYVKYNTRLFNQITNSVTDSMGNEIIPPVKINVANAIEFFKYGAFGTLSKNLFNEKLLLSLGLRTDMNSFTRDGNNPLNTLSPRLSLAYHIHTKFDITASVGSYYKIPTYTSLGFKEPDGTLVNKSAKYIRSDHYVLGTQFLPKESLRFTLEGFYKRYSNYPVSAGNGISLANQGADFGSIGSEKILSIGQGECYGFEFFVQQKLIKRIFYVFSYTFVRSSFSGVNKKLIPSSWDYQHLISATLGYKFKNNWQLGLKYRLSGGSPYTPFDLRASQQNYLLLGTGVLDYNNLNTKRLMTFNQLDLRIDKKFNFKRTTLDLFIDIQNALLFKQESAPSYTFKRNADNTGFETTDGMPV